MKRIAQPRSTAQKAALAKKKSEAAKTATVHTVLHTAAKQAPPRPKGQDMGTDVMRHKQKKWVEKQKKPAKSGAVPTAGKIAGKVGGAAGKAAGAAARKAGGPLAVSSAAGPAVKKVQEKWGKELQADPGYRKAVAAKKAEKAKPGVGIGRQAPRTQGGKARKAH
jgi:hypothetical protein